MKTFLTPLSLEQEKFCLEKLKDNDLESKNRLIEHNLRLVAHICKKYQTVEEDMEDLISIGTIGLIKAISTFDDQKGNRLVTYASRCIENEILMHIRAMKKTARDVSIYEPIGTDKEGNQIQLLDVMESNEPDILEQIEQNRYRLLLYEKIPEVLTERERKILTMRYGLYHTKPITQREISDQMGISRSYVSRIEKRALEKLRICV